MHEAADRLPEAPSLQGALPVGTPEGVPAGALLGALTGGHRGDERAGSLDDPWPLGQGHRPPALARGQRRGRLPPGIPLAVAALGQPRRDQRPANRVDRPRVPCHPRARVRPVMRGPPWALVARPPPPRDGRTPHVLGPSRRSALRPGRPLPLGPVRHHPRALSGRPCLDAPMALRTLHGLSQPAQPRPLPLLAPHARGQRGERDPRPRLRLPSAPGGHARQRGRVLALAPRRRHPDAGAALELTAPDACPDLLHAPAAPAHARAAAHGGMAREGGASPGGDRQDEGAREDARRAPRAALAPPVVDGPWGPASAQRRLPAQRHARGALATLQTAVGALAPLGRVPPPRRGSTRPS
jgi:hypothetical protein